MTPPELLRVQDVEVQDSRRVARRTNWVPAGLLLTVSRELAACHAMRGSTLALLVGLAPIACSSGGAGEDGSDAAGERQGDASSGASSTSGGGNGGSASGSGGSSSGSMTSSDSGGGGDDSGGSGSSSGGGGSSSDGGGTGDDASAPPGDDATVDAPGPPSDAAGLDAPGMVGQPILPGLMPIFDGTTLNGWDGNPAIWSVKDNALHGITQNGGQLIKTTTDYDNFRLVLRARIFPPATNHLGVCIWGAPAAKGNWGYSGCIEFTPGSGSYWDYGKCGNQTYPYVYATKTEWSVFEILANLQTKKVRVAVNGHEVLPAYMECAGSGHQKGPIGLQIHAGASEVEYTDLAIDPAPTQDVLLTTASPTASDP
jgi:hypothetical protein